MEEHTFACGVIYHPPKPVYDTSDFIDSVISTIDNLIMSNTPDLSIVMAGDFNQLSDSDLCSRTGLLSIVTKPTRGQNFLDRVYVSSDENLSVKVVKSSVKSDIQQS